MNSKLTNKDTKMKEVAVNKTPNPFSGIKNSGELSESEKEFIDKNVDANDKRIKKTDRINVFLYVSKETKKKIENYAKNMDRSQNYVMRKALEEWFADK